jgi:hypothetical protein
LAGNPRRHERGIRPLRRTTTEAPEVLLALFFYHGFSLWGSHRRTQIAGLFFRPNLLRSDLSRFVALDRR